MTRRLSGWTALILVLVVSTPVVIATTPARAAGAAIRLAPSVGPPTTQTKVSGKGFGLTEVVDIDVDGTLVGTAVTGPSGKFARKVAIPSSALPGDHPITATGETSGLTATATFTVRTDWTQFHFDNANTGLNPYENILDPSNVDGLVLKWSLNANSWVDSVGVAKDIAYAAGQILGRLDTRVFAVDVATGTQLWARTVQNGGYPSALTIAKDVVYVGTLNDHALHAYDAGTGGTIWSHQAGGAVGTPVVSGNTVYIGVNNGDVEAIDARTGDLVWRTSVGFSTQGQMALAGGALFLGTEDFKVHALDAATGIALWTVSTQGSVHSAPAVFAGVVYVGSTDANVYAIEAASGSVLWIAPTGGAVGSSPAVADGVVYVGSEDHDLYAFDAGTGQQLWTAQTGNAIVEESPVVANGVVYIGSHDFSIYAMNTETGDFLWSYRSGQIIGRFPAVADGVLYVPSLDGNLYSFHLSVTDH